MKQWFQKENLESLDPKMIFTKIEHHIVFREREQWTRVGKAAFTGGRGNAYAKAPITLHLIGNNTL